VLLKRPILSQQLDIDKDVLKLLKNIEFKMCITCWQIVCDTDKSCDHKLTDSFTKMDVADK